MIAKLVNGSVVPCPRQGKDGNDVFHTDLQKYYENHSSVAVDDGYYPVIYTDKPEGNYISSWELINNEIVEVWSAYTPEPDIDIEKLRSDVDYIAMMTDVDLDGDVI